MLSIENFRKRYDDFELDCTMSVEPGQITGIVGANGAGKSTLFKAILGLVKGDSGRITLFGKEPQQLTREDKEKIGVAFTNAGFNEYLRIKDIVPVLSNVYPSFEKEKFLGSCKKLNLSLDKKLKEFSTGMKAKLNVLIAVSHQAPFLILDEPTAGLDVTAREQVLDLLREYMTEVDGRRRFFLASKTARASRVNSGAITTSANWPVMARAVASSTGRLKAMMPPKALLGSVRKAF